MKSIVYILIIVFFSGIIVSALPKSITGQKQVVKIQSVENPTSDLLNKSCSVISKRLNEYGLQRFDISVNEDQKTIELGFSKKVDVKEILPLLTSKGTIAFYETYNRLDVTKLLGENDELFSILNIPSENSGTDESSAVLGYCNPQNKSKVDSYITEYYVSNPEQGIKFLWSEKPNKDGNYELYLLKHNAALDKSQILETSVADDTGLMIAFNNSGTLAWQDLSKNNIGKPIAIVIDNAVYFAPRVMSEIKGGKCQITGDFSAKEISCLKSLINNEELPSEFNLVK